MDKCREAESASVVIVRFLSLSPAWGKAGWAKRRPVPSARYFRRVLGGITTLFALH
jgi:hypothetical protein